MSNDAIAWIVGWTDEVGVDRSVDVTWRSSSSAGPSGELFARGSAVDLGGRPPADAVRRPDHAGRVTALRTAVPLGDGPAAITMEQSVPERPAHPGGAPWAAILPSLVSGTVAALVFSPLFALLAAASATVFLGRWLAAMVSFRRATRVRAVAIEAAAHDLADRVDRWITAEQERRRTQGDVVAALLGEAKEGRTPWHRRLDPEDPLVVTVGVGDVVVALPILGDDDPVDLGVGGECVLSAVPVEVAIEPGRGMAVVGDRSTVLFVARWLIAGSTARYGPADLGLAILTTPDRLVDWDWVKWLPGLAFVAVSGDELELGLQRCTSDGAERPLLVVVDGAEPDGPGSLASIMAGRLGATRVLWLGERHAVPAVCSHRLDVAADRTFGLVDLCGPRLHPGSADQRGRAEGLTEAEAGRVARWLAPFDDPEREEAGARLPSSVPLVEVAGIGGDAEREVREAWRRADRSSLSVAMAVDEGGVVEIDLVADGPHGLVAGTTGSGKSELLRSLVAGLAVRQPPELVSFVLVDFKGGGAFDLVAGLPHVAAVVTDLDAVEASRALRSLRAELSDRERTLRRLGVSDIADVPVVDEQGIPRLVVVVDEFAALADELPDFLDGLVDIARRGRSLGVHLILATQRPAGVVTGQIRANTNLRLCLRVQDRSDSLDVIDVPDAADLPPIPGRAVVRLGSGAVRHLQVGHLGSGPVSDSIEPFVVHDQLLLDRFGGAERLRLVGLLRDELGGSGSSGDAPVPTVDVPRRLVRITAGLAAERGSAEPRAPWLPPLETVGWADLMQVVGGEQVVEAEPAGAALGLLDDPDERRRRPLMWNQPDGLLILGAAAETVESSVTTAVVSSIEASLARGGAVPAVYVLDGGTSGLDRLSVLPAVGDVIPVADPVRLAKAVAWLGRPMRDGSERPLLLIVNGWAAVADALQDEAGLDAVAALTRLIRRSGGSDLRVVVTGSSDRDVPSRVGGQLADRILHRLSDPAGYLSFGLRSSEVPSLSGPRFVDPASSLTGVMATVDDRHVEELADRLREHACDIPWPDPIRVLAACVDRAELPESAHDNGSWVVPIGLDTDLGVQSVRVGPRQSIIVLGQPGSGRTTTIETIRASMPPSVGLVVIDNGEAVGEREAAPLLERAEASAATLVIACTPAAARSFGGWIAPTLAAAQVVLLNPSRAEGELCRVIVPDLSQGPVGRAALVDRGRVTVLQVAA